jgi:hypothetical protein
MKFLRFLINKKDDVVIDSSGASTVNILETILSPEGKKELSNMAKFAEQHNLRQPQSNPSFKSNPQNIVASKILFKLAKSYPQVLTNPESILGPNALKVLEFWRHIDGLSKQEMEELGQRYLALDDKVRDFAWYAANDAAREVVGEVFRAAALCVVCDEIGSEFFGYATLELISGVENMFCYKSVFPEVKWDQKELEQVAEVLFILNKNNLMSVKSLIIHIKSVAESALFRDNRKVCSFDGWCVVFQESSQHFEAKLALLPQTVYDYVIKTRRFVPTNCYLDG